jgi:hypothetical protein
VKNDDGGAAPTQNCTNWVVQGWADVVPEGGDVANANDCSSTIVSVNVSWSPSAEVHVGGPAVNWQRGSHTLGKARRWDVRGAVAVAAAVEWAENHRVSGRRERCENVKKGRKEERRSFGEAASVDERSASILSDLWRRHYASLS